MAKNFGGDRDSVFWGYIGAVVASFLGIRIQASGSSSVRFFLFLSALALILPQLALASPPRARAEHAATPPVIDGRSVGSEWAASSSIELPSEGGVIRCLWRPEGLYFLMRATNAVPVSSKTPPYQSLHQGDVFEVFLDPRGDHRQYYEIQINPAGDVFLMTHVLTAKPRLTPEGRLTPEFCSSELWRYPLPLPEGFKSASRHDPKTGEWIAELFLPAALVNRRNGGGKLEPQKMRVNFVRNDWDAPPGTPGRKGRFYYWAPVLEGHAHLSPTRMGTLDLIAP